MKKKQEDIGLQYMKALDINPAKSGRSLYNQLVDLMGQAEARKYMDKIGELMKNKGRSPEDDAAFYSEKNKNYDIGMLFTGCYEGDLYRKACNWIDEHPEFFGKEILEVGCDTGIMTCFLAKRFPDSHITAIDQFADGIEIARENARRLNLTNITFKQCSMLGVKKQYDTVFAMQLLQENNRHDPNLKFNYFDLLLVQAVSYGEHFVNLAEQLSQHVKKDGLLVSIEANPVDPLLLGWMNELNYQECGILPGTYSDLLCRELDTVTHLQVFAAMKGHKQEDVVVYNMWCQSVSAMYDNSGKSFEYSGWNAEMLLQNSLKDLIYGYYVFNQDDWIVAKYALWTETSDDTAILYYDADNDHRSVMVYDLSLKDHIVEEMKKGIPVLKDMGLHTREFVYENNREHILDK